LKSRLYRTYLRWAPALLGGAVLLSHSFVALAQTAPHRTLTNGLIRTNVYLPDEEKGFYRGTRFEWAGVIGDFTYAGHSFYNPWFTKMEPGVSDFVFRGADIVAGEASAITGPAEEFVSDDGALNYASAPAGGTFIKIGVGLLRKPDSGKYNKYRLYQIVDGGRWTVDEHSDWISLTQRLIDKESGTGYVYRKTIRLIPGEPKMRIEHSLKNIGENDIETIIFLLLMGRRRGLILELLFRSKLTPKSQWTPILEAWRVPRSSTRSPWKGKSASWLRLEDMASPRPITAFQFRIPSWMPG
jgi:hypothetical protein